MRNNKREMSSKYAVIAALCLLLAGCSREQDKAQAASTATPEPATPSTVVFNAAAFAALSPWKGIEDDTSPGLLALIDLSGREGYLAWVSAWKAEYKATSARIREARAAFRAAGFATGWSAKAWEHSASSSSSTAPMARVLLWQPA